MNRKVHEAAANGGTGDMTLELIIEDSPEVRNVLEAVLRSMGVESVTAPDSEGLALLRSSLHPDLVISDISMPGIDGIELFKAVQQHG
jgi:CheY-like chemotaxis protein